MSNHQIRTVSKKCHLQGHDLIDNVTQLMPLNVDYFIHGYLLCLRLLGLKSNHIAELK